MNYTVLGSAGFIGSALCNYIRSQGIICKTIDKNYVFSKAENLGHVFYCIGLTADFRTRPMETVKAHVCKLIEVLESSTFESFLYLSSARIYNGNQNGGEEATLNVNPFNFSDLYNISKLMGEAVCLSIANKNIRIARLSNVVGNDFNSDNFLFSLIKDAVDKQVIKLNISPNSSKDYISIDDVVSLLEMIAVNGSERVYNISSGVSITNEQLVNEIKRYTNCNVEFIGNENSLIFPIIQNEKIIKEFSFSPKAILPEIKRLVEQYKKKAI